MTTLKRVRARDLAHHWELYLFILPTVALIALFQYYPAASGVFHSFFRWNGYDIAEWVGARNYLDLLRAEGFWDSFAVAGLLGAWNVLKMAPALLVAVCIHRCRSTRMQFVYRSLFVVPMVIPGLIVAFLWRSFFFEPSTGYLNRFLHATGLMDVLGFLDARLGWGGMFAAGQNPAWLGDPRLILVAIVVWGFPWVGSFAVLTHLAKLQGISKEVYEAAEMDGVTWWSKFWHVELPLIASSIYLLLVFVIIDTVKDAGLILALAGMEGGPGGRATVPALFMLRKAFIDQQMGYACAVGVVLTLVVIALQRGFTAVANWSTLARWERLAWRLGVLGVGLGLLVIGRFVPVAAVLVAVALPWNVLPWGRWSAAWGARRATAAGEEHRFTERGTSRQTDGLHRPRRAVELGLRGLKHATIWGVLAFAFLPLYLMLVVSGKTNEQFYAQPAGLSLPFHWENWRFAWEAITPTVANSMFVSATATGLGVAAALAAAYFFARLRMPLSGALWNAILVLLMMPAIANLVPLFRLLGDLNLLNTLSALILVGASAGLVFAIFVLRNFVADIPQDLFEAAEIDGASHFRQLLTIVVPLSGPILGTVGVMVFLSQWNEFVLPLIVMRDHARLPVMVALQRLSGEYVKFWGPLMAGYAIACVPIIALFLLSMRFFVRGLTEGASKG